MKIVSAALSADNSRWILHRLLSEEFTGNTMQGVYFSFEDLSLNILGFLIPIKFFWILWGIFDPN